MFVLVLVIRTGESGKFKMKSVEGYFVVAGIYVLVWGSICNERMRILGQISWGSFGS